MAEDVLGELRGKMSQALALIKEALNISIPLLRSEHKQSVVALWEAFMREFITYVKHKSRETGSNLISFISFRRVWLR